MKPRNVLFLAIFLVFVSCRRDYNQQQQTTNQYHDIEISDTVELDPLIAVTYEEYLQYGSNVAFVNIHGDTIIPYGNFAYFGTDTLKYFANVLLHPNDTTYGGWVGIDRNGNILFDLVNFDNGPDYFNEGLMRVRRNGKMGFANERGEVVISCQYAFAKWFDNGVAEVTFEAKEYLDLDEHTMVKSDSWFEIDKKGNWIKAP